VLAMVAPICALPPLSDSLRESGSHLNVRCRTLMFVKGVGRATQGVQVSYCWLATQMGVTIQCTYISYFPSYDIRFVL